MKRAQKLTSKESVWDYPQLPEVERCDKRIRVDFAGTTIADSGRAVRVLQRGIPPVYYLPPEDVRLELLTKSSHHSFCNYKGQANYYTVTVGDRVARNAVWSYPESPPESTPSNYFAFYAHLLDACWVGDEKIAPPPWTWLGGWVSRDTAGPFLSPTGLSTF